MSYGTGDPNQQWSGQWYEEEPQGGMSGGVIALLAVLTIVVLGLLAVVGFLFLRPGGVSGLPDELPAAATSSSETTEPTTQETTTSRASTSPSTTTTSSSRETVTVTSTAQRPDDSGDSFPYGTDSSGWISNRQARCNAGDPATMIGRTSNASFSICTNPDNGRHYYRGSAGGSGVEVDDPVVSGRTARVTNGNVVYSISPDAMEIFENGNRISEQQMIDFWTGR